MEIVITERSLKDLSNLPEEVESTFRSKKKDASRNLSIGADTGDVFDKYLSGNMHPVLQMNLGRDYRAWFLEGKYVEELEEDMIYCWRVLTKNEAEKLAGKINDPLAIFQSDL